MKETDVELLVAVDHNQLRTMSITICHKLYLNVYYAYYIKHAKFHQSTKIKSAFTEELYKYSRKFTSIRTLYSRPPILV